MDAILGKREKRFIYRFLTEKKWAVSSLIILVTVVWGYAWVLMKISLDYMGPFTFSAFRFGVGTLTLFLFVFAKRMPLPQRKEWQHLIIIGLLQTTIVFLLVMYGMRFVGAGKSSVILYSMPIWSSLLAIKYLNEKITRIKFSGIMLGMLGLMVILGWDIWMSENVQAIFGNILILIAAFSWACSNVYFKKKNLTLNGLQLTAYQMLFGTVGIIIAAIFMEWGEPIDITPTSLYSVLFTGVFASALSFTIWFYLLTFIDTVTATLSTLLVPIFGLFFSWLILSEPLTTEIILGSILILIGIVVAKK